MNKHTKYDMYSWNNQIWSQSNLIWTDKYEGYPLKYMNYIAPREYVNLMAFSLIKF